MGMYVLNGADGQTERAMLKRRRELERQVVDRMIEAYKNNSCEVAEAMDTRIDRSGNLLGWIRELEELLGRI